MGRFFQRLVDLVEWWAVLLLILMVVVVSLGVFFRYVVNAALVWYDEFASYLLVWLTFLGAVVASHHRRHIGFELLQYRLTPRTWRVVDCVSELCVLGFQGVLLWYGWLLTRKMGDETAVSLEWVKMGWVYSVLPLSGGLMLLISLRRVCRILSGTEGQPGGGEAWSGLSSE
ncbi:MAG: TRAP transporter small permease [Candidatus Methylomirabilota bacterium]